MRIVCGIYFIICRATGESYVGSSEDIDRRWSTHRSQLRRRIHHSKLLQQRWLEYGSAEFDFVIHEVIAVDGLLKREREHMVTGRHAFNATVPVRNPMKGRRHSPESIALMRENRKGKPGRPKGVPISDRHKHNLSDARKGRRFPGKGRHLSREQAREMALKSNVNGNAFTGRKHSEATRQKMRDAARARNPDSYLRGDRHPSHQRKLRAAMRKS